MTTEEPTARGIIRNWWRHEIGDRQSSPARALAARLRRATAIEALSEPAVHRLADRLGSRDAQRLHRLVSVLAHLREDAGQRLPQKLGALRRDDGPNLRFQQLMRAEGEALTTALVRALPMAGNACNAGALGADIYFWTDDTRTRWTFDYFGAAAPESLEETPE
ncbi:MAG: hypothetical protein LCH69_02295 [Proteobacteria bacterium]|nr:hypothetical protein [Pseudomonadota bacterium]